MTSSTRALRSVLYRLKRRWGSPIKIAQVVEKVFDPATGEQIPRTRVADIKRAIVLPNALDRKFAFDLSYVAHNRDFTYGATFDKGERRFLVDAKDCPFLPKIDDTILFNERRWSILTVEEFDPEIGYMLTAREGTNASHEVLKDAAASNTLALGQTASTA